MPASPVAPSQVKALIHSIRGVEVLLDGDAARLLGIDLLALTECVAQSPHLFPSDFVFPLDGDERVASTVRIALGESRRRSPILAFTEHGIAHVLRQFDSPERGRILVAILRGFTLYRRAAVLNN